MEPEHTYLLPARNRIIGALSEDPRVIEILQGAWRRYGHESPGPFDGVSFLPNAGKVRVVVTHDGEFEVFDVDAETLDRA